MFFESSTAPTRGHSLKLVKPRCHLHVIKFTFFKLIISLTKYKQYYACKHGSSYIAAYVYLTVDLVLQQSVYCGILCKLAVALAGINICYHFMCKYVLFQLCFWVIRVSNTFPIHFSSY